MACEFGVASAAIGIAQRKGLGTIRHLDTHSLWEQGAVKEKRVQLTKVRGAENPAGMMTAHLDSASALGLMRRLVLEDREGRAEIAPQLAEDFDLEEIQQDNRGCEIDTLVAIHDDELNTSDTVCCVKQCVDVFDGFVLSREACRS